MTGILNHPKMPVVAGSLALALLAGGVYSSMEQSNPVASSVRKVDAAAKAAFASSTKAPAPASSQKPDGNAQPHSGSRATEASAAPAPVIQAVEPLRAAVPAPQQVLVAENTQRSPVQAVAQQAVSAKPTERLIVQPIMPTAPASATPATAASNSSLTPVSVKPSPVVRVTVPDSPVVAPAPVAPVQPVVPVQSVKETRATSSDANTLAPVHHAEVVAHEPTAVRVAKSAVAPAKKKKKHHVEEQEDNSGGATAPEKPITVKTETIKVDGGTEYTEIKGTATSEMLRQPQGTTQPTPPAQQKEGPSTYRPNVVASSGGQAWVRISPERTIVVKAGDSVPGLGKVTAVSGSAIETDKGKFSVNSKE